MNIGGDFSIGQSQHSAPGVSKSADAAAFNKALDAAAKHVQTIVPIASEAGQMALAKKKEKKAINRVQEAQAASDDSDIESVDQVVKHITSQIRFLAEMERHNIGL